MPDLAYLHRELKRPHMTLMLLWVEYREAHPDGYGYTQFCEYYRRFARTLSPTMRCRHVAGAKTFVDFAGDGLPIYGPDDEIEFYAQIFVAVLGASNLTYVEALANQNLYHVITGPSRTSSRRCLVSGTSWLGPYPPWHWSEVRLSNVDLLEHADYIFKNRLDVVGYGRKKRYVGRQIMGYLGRIACQGGQGARMRELFWSRFLAADDAGETYEWQSANEPRRA